MEITLRYLERALLLAIAIFSLWRGLTLGRTKEGQSGAEGQAAARQLPLRLLLIGIGVVCLLFVLRTVATH